MVKSKKEKRTFYVDIPTMDCVDNFDGAYMNVAEFDSRAEAIAFAREHFGADKNGKVDLVTG